jgi:hypothetical protein
MLGELILEERGKVTGNRVLPDGKVELSSQSTGKLLGVDCAGMMTAVFTWSGPSGSATGEGTEMIRTRDGDVVLLKHWGTGRIIGPGWKASFRGVHMIQTASPKLGARLNNSLSVWEEETDESGNYNAKAWEWK